MDSFQIAAEDTTVLDTSLLVDELRTAANSTDMFPVLFGGQIGYFHNVDGGFDRKQDYHVVNLIHRVQGPDSPPNKYYDDTVEIHLDDKFYNMEVADVWAMGDYPDDNFVVSLKVTDYQIGPYSFSEAMSEDIDKRDGSYSHNNE